MDLFSRPRRAVAPAARQSPSGRASSAGSPEKGTPEPWIAASSPQQLPGTALNAGETECSTAEFFPRTARLLRESPVAATAARKRARAETPRSSPERPPPGNVALELLAAKKELHRLRQELVRERASAAHQANEAAAENALLQKQVQALSAQTAENAAERTELLDKADRVRRQADAAALAGQQAADEHRKQARALQSDLAAARTLTQTLSEQVRAVEAVLGVSRGSNIAQAVARRLEELQRAAAAHEAGEAESRARALQLERRAADFQARDVQLLKPQAREPPTTPSHAATIQHELAQQLTYVRRLERQVGQLRTQLAEQRSRNLNAELLREERDLLARDVARLRKLEARLVQLELQAAAPPEALPEKTAIPSMSEKTLTVALQETQGELRSRLEQLDNARSAADKQRAELLQVKRALAHESRRRELAERAKAIARDEAALLREQLESVELDAEVIDLEARDSAAGKKVADLEDFVSKQRAELDRLTAECDALQAARTLETVAPVAPAEPLEPLAVELNETRQDRDALAKQLDQAHAMIDALERSLGMGLFNPAVARVLELQANPAVEERAVRQSTLDRLRAENTQLLRDLAAGTPAEAGPFASVARLEAEVAALQTQLGDRDKRVERIKDVYRVKALELREIVYALLGYRLDIRPNGKARVTTCLAALRAGGSPIRLVFEFSGLSPDSDDSGVKPAVVGTSGALQVITDMSDVSVGGVSGAQWLSSLVDEYLVRHSSVPAFLSRVSLDLLQTL